MLFDSQYRGGREPDTHKGEVVIPILQMGTLRLRHLSKVTSDLVELVQQTWEV